MHSTRSALAPAAVWVAVLLGLPPLLPAAPFPGLSSQLPYDVDEAQVRALVRASDALRAQGQAPAAQQKLLEAHRLFSILSWQAFVALNWPAGDNGEPDAAKNMADNTTWRVWNYWRSSGSIFLPDGAKPEAWNGRLQKSARLKSLANHPGRIGLRDNFEAFTGPLVDQNGKWARFEIRVNRREFDYIYRHELYSQDGQVAFSHREKDNVVDLPVNEGNAHGAIEIKLAWKELGPGDDPSRFYTTDLTVTRSEPEGTPNTVQTIHVGLVGMHIAMRTRSSPEWIWSTFEQIDNVRRNPLPGGGQSHANFVAANYAGSDYNVLPTPNAVPGPHGFPVPASPPSATTWIESSTTTPVQVKRVDVPTQPELNPLDASCGAVARDLNTEVQKLLHDAQSVFQYYELIDTQWPVHPNAPAVAGGAGSAPESVRYKTPGEMIPVFLINTTMETYFQKGEQEAGNLEQDDRLAQGNAIVDATKVNGTESCVGCHYSSGIAIGFKHSADGRELLDATGRPIAIYGENNHFGKTGGANFSWMLQQEPQAKPRVAGATPAKPEDTP